MCKTESGCNSTQRPLKPKPVVEDDPDDDEKVSGEHEVIMCFHTCGFGL